MDSKGSLTGLQGRWRQRHDGDRPFCEKGLTDAVTLSESMLITVYVDGVSPNLPMLPTVNLAEVLHLAGLGQNLMDAAFTTVIARKHYNNEIDESELGQRRSRAIQRLLNQLNSELGEKQQASTINLGEITIAIALDYLAFRLPEVNWKEEYPQLQVWHCGVTSRASFQDTAFA